MFCYAAGEYSELVFESKSVSYSLDLLCISNSLSCLSMLAFVLTNASRLSWLQMCREEDVLSLEICVCRAKEESIRKKVKKMMESSATRAIMNTCSTELPCKPALSLHCALNI